MHRRNVSRTPQFPPSANFCASQFDPRLAWRRSLLDRVCPCHIHDLTIQLGVRPNRHSECFICIVSSPTVESLRKSTPDGNSGHPSGMARKMASVFIAQRLTIQNLVHRSHSHGGTRRRTRSTVPRLISMSTPRGGRAHECSEWKDQTNRSEACCHVQTGRACAFGCR